MTGKWLRPSYGKQVQGLAFIISVLDRIFVQLDP
jgi:hypothetical protein